MNITLKNILGLTAILTLLAVSALYIASVTLVGKAANPGNLPSTAATSSIINLLGAGDGTTAKVLFEPNNACSSRIVTTGFHNVLLAFEADRDSLNNGVSSTTLTLAVGHWQAASTTVAYPAENYGCGWVTGIVGNTSGVADLASTTLSVTETF